MTATTTPTPLGLPAPQRDALLSGAVEQAASGISPTSFRRLLRKYVTTRLRTPDEALDPANLKAWERERKALRAWFDRQPGRRSGPVSGGFKVKPQTPEAP